MTVEQITVPAMKAPVKAMWVCMVLSWILFIMPIPGTIFLAGPLNLAAFILAIVCLIRSRVGQGVMGLVGTTIISVIAYFIGLTLMTAGVAGAAAAGAQAQQNKVAAEVASATNIITVSAAVLIADYQANEVAADQKYKGKVLEVSGVIDSIGKDIVNTPQISLSSGRMDTFRTVQCSFTGSQEGELAALSKGGSITIRGKCRGLMGNVLIDSSVIVK